MAARGVYREQHRWGNQNSAGVRYDDGKEADIPEDDYRSQGYQPSFDDLPWKEERLAASALGAHWLTVTKLPARLMFIEEKTWERHSAALEFAGFAVDAVATPRPCCRLS
jgi:hypothetical protein